MRVRHGRKRPVGVRLLPWSAAAKPVDAPGGAGEAVEVSVVVERDDVALTQLDGFPRPVPHTATGMGSKVTTHVPVWAARDAERAAVRRRCAVLGGACALQTPQIKHPDARGERLRSVRIPCPLENLSWRSIGQKPSAHPQQHTRSSTPALIRFAVAPQTGALTTRAFGRSSVTRPSLFRGSLS